MVKKEGKEIKVAGWIPPDNKKSNNLTINICRKKKKKENSQSRIGRKLKKYAEKVFGLDNI